MMSRSIDVDNGIPYIDWMSAKATAAVGPDADLFRCLQEFKGPPRRSCSG